MRPPAAALLDMHTHIQTYAHMDLPASFHSGADA